MKGLHPAQQWVPLVLVSTCSAPEAASGDVVVQMRHGQRDELAVILHRHTQEDTRVCLVALV